MDNEFTISRVKKKLADYCARLDAISDEFETATYDRKEELLICIGEIRKEIESEENRVNKNIIEDIGVECTNYLPAIQEAHMYLNQALDPESNQRVLSCLHDATFSLGYYLHDVQPYKPIKIAPKIAC